MANSVDPDQTAPIGAVCSGSTLFASILNSVVMFAAEDFSRRQFQMHFCLGALRVKTWLLLSSSDSLCKLFGPISGQTDSLTL